MNRLLMAVAALMLGTATAAAATPVAQLPTTIDAGVWRAGHIQGIAVDSKREYCYFSFTTMLVKTDMSGKVVGTVTGLLGHLGCIEFNDEDGRIYGSLEYKSDSIGRGILKQENSNRKFDTAFYVAIFDVDKITRTDMNAEKDGIMTSVYLQTVLDDFEAEVVSEGKTLKHRYGCSGFDGITFGPKFGSRDGKKLLTIAYGIYTDTKRNDNNHQVLLQFDTKNWSKYEQPLSQDCQHKSGPKRECGRYFVYTGNTRWGVQNMEYDATDNKWMIATYPTDKKSYTDFTLFAVDGNIAPYKGTLRGVEYQKKGKLLTLTKGGQTDPMNPEIRGWHFDKAAVGIAAIGDNYFYISHRYGKKPMQGGKAVLFRFTGNAKQPFDKVW